MGDFVGMEGYIELKNDDISTSEKGVSRHKERRENEGFPPPLPPRGALRRYHTSDGRLVIESGRLPEMLWTHRENNRLTIDLFSLKNDPKTDGGDDHLVDDKAEDEAPVKIHKYDYGVRSNPCMVGMAVPVIRHVPI